MTYKGILSSMYALKSHILCFAYSIMVILLEYFNIMAMPCESILYNL